MKLSIATSLFVLASVSEALSTAELKKVQIGIENIIWQASASVTPARSASCTVGGCSRTTQQGGTVNGGITLPNSWSTDQGRAAAVASMVRLGFHDAGPYNAATNTGGANGCIDFSDPDNAGLQAIVGTLSTLQSSLASSGVVISKADLFQYAALTSIWSSLPVLPKGSTTDTVSFPFKTGRVDQGTCDFTLDAGRLPRAEGGYGELQGLVSRWGLAIEEVSSLLGAHTLGSTKLTNSGYSAPTASPQGKWTNNNAFLNGQAFYSGIINIPWTRQTSNAGKHSWINSPPNDPSRTTIMLNTDISIFFDAEQGKDINTNTCRIAGPNGRPQGPQQNNCPIMGAVTNANGASVRSATLLATVRKSLKDGVTTISNSQQLIREYADNTAIAVSTIFQGASSVGQDTWFPDFITSYLKLSELGYSGKLAAVVPAVAVTSPPTQATTTTTKAAPPITTTTRQGPSPSPKPNGPTPPPNNRPAPTVKANNLRVNNFDVFRDSDAPAESSGSTWNIGFFCYAFGWWC